MTYDKRTIQGSSSKGRIIIRAVEVQTRLRSLKVIVRARDQERFRGAGLDVKSERPPVYWYLRLASDADLAAVLKMIDLADRK